YTRREGSADSEVSPGGAIDGDKYGRPLSSQRLGAGQIYRDNSTGATGDRALDARTLAFLERVDRSRLPGQGVIEDAAQWMRRTGSEAFNPSRLGFFQNAGESDLLLAVRYRAGLVEHNGVSPGHPFDDLCIFQIESGPPENAHHIAVGERSRQRQGTRTRHNEHSGDVKPHLRRVQQVPSHRCRRRYENNGPRKPGGNPVHDTPIVLCFFLENLVIP